jgi:very-short-patch-repair endonuclease
MTVARNKNSRSASSKELKARFLAALSQRFPSVSAEHKFHPTRKWRFDYCLVHHRLAIEVEGGVGMYGGHNRPGGFRKDIEKYNMACVFGFRLYRIDHGDLRSERKILEHISNIAIAVGEP